MDSQGSHPSAATSATGTAGQSGLSSEHRAALGEAAEMIANGASTDAAVAHLVAKDIPKVVAKVLVKQYDKRAS